jgi:hypothetical protein
MLREKETGDKRHRGSKREKLSLNSLVNFHSARIVPTDIHTPPRI